MVRTNDLNSSFHFIFHYPNITPIHTLLVILCWFPFFSINHKNKSMMMPTPNVLSTSAPAKPENCLPRRRPTLITSSFAYSPPYVDRIRPWVSYNKIPIYSIVYLLKGDYNPCLLEECLSVGKALINAFPGLTNPTPYLCVDLQAT